MAFVAYGVRLETAFHLKNLPTASASDSSIQVQIDQVEALPANNGRVLQTFTAGTRDVRVMQGVSSLFYLIDDRLSFELDTATAAIRCLFTRDTPEALLVYWLLQRMLPIYRVLSGAQIFLHAGAVSAEPVSSTPETGCIGFFGPSYAGKSTMLAHFLSMGHSLLTDDHLALPVAGQTTGGDVCVTPAIPYYRPYRAMEQLGVVAENFASNPLPLRSLFILHPAAADAEVHMERVRPFDMLSLLLEDLHYRIDEAEVPAYASVIENRFRGFSQVARKVPVWRLHVPRSMDRLPEVYQFIMNATKDGAADAI